MISHPTKRNRLYSVRGDAEVLKSLSDFHFLQPTHFEKLTGRMLHSVRRRLLQLHRSGLVERLTLPVEREWPIGNPPDQFVYRLSRKGLERAQGLGFADERSRFNSEKRNTLLAHELLITNFHLALELAGRAGHWQILSWEQRRAELLDRAIGQRGEPVSINPDSLFALKNPTAPPGQNSRYFFFEMVRARESKYQNGESYLIQKMRAYQLYAEQGRHKQSWGIPDFRVVVVLPTPERARNLLVKLEESKLAFKRFWLADVGSYSLDEPARIAGQIFRTPRDYQAGAVYSLWT